MLDLSTCSNYNDSVKHGVVRLISMMLSLTLKHIHECIHLHHCLLPVLVSRRFQEFAQISCTLPSNTLFYWPLRPWNDDPIPLWPFRKATPTRSIPAFPRAYSEVITHEIIPQAALGLVAELVLNWVWFANILYIAWNFICWFQRIIRMITIDVVVVVGKK